MRILERCAWCGVVAGLGWLTLSRITQIEKRLQSIENRIFEVDRSFRDHQGSMNGRLDALAGEVDAVLRAESYLVAESTGQARSHVAAAPSGVSVFTTDAQTVYRRIHDQAQRRAGGVDDRPRSV